MLHIFKCPSVRHFQPPEMAFRAMTLERLLRLRIGNGLLNSCNCANAMANVLASHFSKNGLMTVLKLFIGKCGSHAIKHFPEL